MLTMSGGDFSSEKRLISKSMVNSDFYILYRMQLVPLCSVACCEEAAHLCGFGENLGRLCSQGTCCP